MTNNIPDAPSKKEWAKAHSTAERNEWRFCSLSQKPKQATLRTGSKREAQRAKARWKSKAERIEGIKVPDHIKVISYDSVEFSDMARNEKAYITMRGEAQHLWGEGQELRQRNFEDMEPQEFITNLMSNITDERMMEIERRHAKKFGSYKPLPYEKWADKVHDLWMDVPWNPDRVVLAKAKDIVVRELREALIALTGQDRIAPLSVDDALVKVTKGRNSGWPFFSNKWHLKDEMLNYYIEQANDLLDGVDALDGIPHILYKRVQPNGETPKMRAVECPPKSEAIAAKCLTDKFIEVFKTMKPYCGFNGGEFVYRELDEFMKYEVLVESDFSSFDQRVVHLMPHVFQVIARVVPEEYWQYLENTLKFYRYGKLATPIGILSSDRPNGLMSGEGWTSVIGTLANSISVVYTMMRMGVEDYSRLSFGDDIAIACNEFNVDEFEERMLELGMDCNKSKQNASTGPQAGFSFLGWYHFRDRWMDGNEGIFPIARLAPSLYYREYYLKVDQVKCEVELTEEEMELLDRTPQAIDMIATVSKINNARNHPDFRRFLEWARPHCLNHLDTQTFLPLEKIKEAIRNGRKTRGLGLVNTPAVRLLLEIEGRQSSPNLPALLENLETPKVGGLDLNWFL